MDAPPQTRAGFRISLKWLLIVVPILGVICSLMLRLFFTNSTWFRITLLLVTVLLPYLVALTLMFWLGWREKRGYLIAIAVLLLVLPCLGWAAIAAANKYVTVTPTGISAVSNYELIHIQLPRRIEQMGVWDELTLRLKTNSLSQAEVDDVLEQLGNSVSARSQDDWNRMPAFANDFLTQAYQKSLITDAAQISLCDAYYGLEPKINLMLELREGPGESHVTIEYGEHMMMQSEVLLQLVWNVEEILLDNKPIKFEKIMKMGKEWVGTVSADFPAGEHELTAILKCGYLPSRSRPWIDHDDVESSKWAKTALKVWDLPVSRPLKIQSVRESPLALVTEEQKDPFVTNTLRLERIAVQTGAKGKTIQAELFIAQEVPVPLAFAISMKLGDKDIQMGSFSVTGNSDKPRRIGNFQAHVDELSDEIVTADVVLTPTPEKLSSIAALREVWAKPIIFKDVKLERLDLEDYSGKGQK
jgi:hypothetical protein